MAPRMDSMNRHTRRWLKGCGLAALLLLIASLFSFDLHDPTITNLRYPKDGIANLAGLPGALAGGSLVEMLGASSLWIPALLASWMLIPPGQRDLGSYLLFGGAGILFSATLHGLLVDNIIPGLTAPGLAGIAGSRWMLRTMDSSVAAPLMAAAMVFSLAQLVQLPLLGAALGNGRKLARYFGRVALARAAAWWVWWRKIGGRAGVYVRNRLSAWGRPGRAGSALRRGVAHATHPQTGVTGKPPAPTNGGVRDGVDSGAQGGSPPGEARPVGKRSLGSGGMAAAGMAEKGEFDAWIPDVGKPAEPTGPTEKP